MSHQLPVTDGGCVPVFDCRVIVSPTDDGKVRARCANLNGIEATGTTERDALMVVVKAFKAEVARLHAAGEPIPFREPPEPPGDGEAERWLPVHL